MGLQYFISVKVISATDNTSASFDYGLGNSIIENPLVDAANGQDAHANNDHISVSVLNHKGKNNATNTSQYDEDQELNLVGHHQKYSSRYRRAKLSCYSASIFNHQQLKNYY